MSYSAEDLPRHIGIIMDGNGRWAKKRGLPRQAGHKAGANTFRRIVRYCNRIGIECLTVYAFSTENWKRPPEEVKGIIALLRNYLADAKNHKGENVRTRFVGDFSVFDEDIRKSMRSCEAESAELTGLLLNIAVNYGGQDDILNATRCIASSVAAGRLALEDITKQTVSDHLYTSGEPDIDLVIRPSGEMRLSNFMLWQTAYAEFVFMDVLWPDFDEACMEKALSQYATRNRRFGGI